MDPASSLFSPIDAFVPWAGYSQDLWHCLFKSAPMQQIIASGYQVRCLRLHYVRSGFGLTSGGEICSVSRVRKRK